MHKSVCCPYSNPMELCTLDRNQHLSSQETLFCLIACLSALSYAYLASFVCPRLALFVSMFFECSPYLLLFLSCLSASMFLLSLHVHAWSMDFWSKGATSQVQAKRARMQARGYKPTKGNVQQIRGTSPSKVVFSFSLSLSHFSRACIRVPPLLVPFTFPTLCLGHVPQVWQYLFYISCTLLSHTLGPHVLCQYMLYFTTRLISCQQMLLSEFDIVFVMRKAIKVQAIADYLMDQPLNDLDFSKEDVLAIKPEPDNVEPWHWKFYLMELPIALEMEWEQFQYPQKVNKSLFKSS